MSGCLSDSVTLANCHCGNNTNDDNDYGKFDKSETFFIHFSLRLFWSSVLPLLSQRFIAMLKCQDNV